MAPRGLFDKPITDTKEGSKRVKNPALLFVLEATVVIGLIVLVGLERRKHRFAYGGAKSRNVQFAELVRAEAKAHRG